MTQQGLAGVHNRYGIRLANEGKIDEAVNQFKEALRFWPDSPDAHINLGKVFAQIGKTDLAIQHCTQ